jgi:hypothetical protein
MLNRRALLLATLIGTVLQLGMVLLGHGNTSIANMFAAGGMTISLIAGAAYSLLARNGAAAASPVVGGLIAGAVCAFIGIVVSYMLGDVTAFILLAGTASSAVTGALGGWLGKIMTRRGSGVAATILVCLIPAGARGQGSVSNTSMPTTLNTVSTRDFAWLAGRWEGHMSSGARGVADVTFAPPVGGLITGMMRLVDNNAVLVVELISLVDTPNGVEMRFRHFSPSLEAYEATFKQAMRLGTHAPDRFVFENVVPYEKSVMSTQPRVTVFQRVGENSFIGKSDIIGENGKPAVIEVTYKRIP